MVVVLLDDKTRQGDEEKVTTLQGNEYYVKVYKVQEVVTSEEEIPN